MSDSGKTHQKNMPKRWVMIIGIFVIVELIFFIVDGTPLEPNLNDIGKWVLDLRLLTEWITLYSFSFFNMCILIHIIAILGQALHDIVSIMSLKNKEG